MDKATLLRAFVFLWMLSAGFVISSPLNRPGLDLPASIVFAALSLIGSAITVVLGWLSILTIDLYYDIAEKIPVDSMLVFMIYSLTFFLNLRFGVL